jgi:hypothetical protein
MKRIAIALVLLSLSAGARSQEESPEFLSWYDGWGTHTVWGAGKVTGSYREARVQCGSASIPVRAIYDTHNTDRTPLSYTQTRRFARLKNAGVLRKLKSRGDKCVFQ